MTPRNLVILLLTVCGCFVCAVKANQSRYVGIMNEAMHIVSREFVRPISEKELFEKAMNGMLADLDPNTEFIPASEYRRFEEEITNEFGGIGVSANFDDKGEKLIVASPMPNTPAIRAGLKPFDEIVSIDGELTRGKGQDWAHGRLRGAPGTQVVLEVLSRGAEKTRRVNVKRDFITLQTVLGDVLLPNGEWDYRLADRPDIAYLRISSFGEGTAEKAEEALQFRGEKPRGVILDLRDNPGGLLDAATYICDLFLSEGLIVQTRGRDALLLETHYAHPGDEIDSTIPVVVLINEDSASASEIVAACLQDQRRAKVVGTQSYGKGTVQNVVRLQGGRSALRLTIASYWRPSGKDIQAPKEKVKGGTWGVSPDEGYEFPVSDEQRIKAFEFRANRDLAEFQRFSSKSNEAIAKRGNLLESDTQLKKAVECIDALIPK